MQPFVLILHKLLMYNDRSADVDECDGVTHGCAQICTNTEGSYNCSCNPGFELANDQRLCDGKKLFILLTCVQP